MPGASPPAVLPPGPTPKEILKRGASTRPRCMTKRNVPTFLHSSWTSPALRLTPLALLMLSPGATWQTGWVSFHSLKRPPVIALTHHGSPSCEARSTPSLSPSRLSSTMTYCSPSRLSRAGSGKRASHFNSTRPRPLAMRKPVPPLLLRVVAECTTTLKCCGPKPGKSITNAGETTVVSWPAKRRASTSQRTWAPPPGRYVHATALLPVGGAISATGAARRCCCCCWPPCCTSEPLKPLLATATGACPFGDCCCGCGCC
mmetsp:Transcript_56545/g.172162  ORF Transcript_56545/g.172162 Transcript_56545/m.172162 type:complete len:259 (-) Transcript_56545:805-1581(-)